MLKDAFDIYFKKLENYWKSKDNSFPKVPYRKTIDINLVQPNTLENGYVQWLPKLQSNITDINDVEIHFGQKMHPEIFQYFTTYWFLSLRGMIANIEIDLYPIPSNVDTAVLVKNSFNVGKKNFSDESICFEIGNACIDEDDSYLVYVDNYSGNVFAVEFNTNKRVEISDSLFDLLKKLDVNF